MNRKKLLRRIAKAHELALYWKLRNSTARYAKTVLKEMAANFSGAITANSLKNARKRPATPRSVFD